MSDVKQVLTEARAIIAKGWCRGEYKKGDRYCTTGAVGASAGLKFKPAHSDGLMHEGSDEAVTLWNLALDVLSDTLGPEHCWCGCSLTFQPYLAEWNDDQPSKKPVLELFDKAIASLS